MRDFAALAYLDGRLLLHRIQTALRQPARAIMYALALGWLIMMAFLRAHSPAPVASVTVPEPFASAIMFAFVALLGIFMYGAASGYVGVFSSPADARFLCGSHLSETAVVTWLQLRRCATVLLRTAIAVIFYSFILWTGARAGATGVIGISVIGATLLVAATAVPVLKLREAAGARFAKTLSAAIVAAGLLPVAVLLGSLLNPALLRCGSPIERLGAGFAANALLHGSAPAVGALYAAAAATIALSLFCGRDLYPELYSSSLRMLEFRSRQRRSAFFSSERAYQSAPARSNVFEGARGAWTIAWKEWIAFVRAPGSQRMFWLGLFGCALAGAIFGNVARQSRDPAGTALGFLIGVANMVIIFITIASSFGLAADLRKPLWWMGPDPIWLRLFAWVLATSWRLSICIGVAALVFAIMLGLGGVAAAAIPIAIAVAIYLRSIGLALYALLPAGLDQRGPLAMLRAFLTYVFAIPAIAVTTIFGVLAHSLLAGAAAGIICALGEALLLIGFAAARIQGRGATFAQAESA